MSSNVYIIAGPNGAGKTTFAREFLPNYAHCPNFVNADLIAARLSLKAPERVAIAAGRQNSGRCSAEALCAFIQEFLEVLPLAADEWTLFDSEHRPAVVASKARGEVQIVEQTMYNLIVGSI